ncbi:hypothetical protein KGV52_00445, partial [Candidatus Gracilibacteria bacterium]|nr:hypothetical protein [Candidatus Gracilibacteria bacterium]
MCNHNQDYLATKRHSLAHIMAQAVKQNFPDAKLAIGPATDDYWVSLSVRGEDREKYLGSEEVWEKAESALEEASKENNLPYKRVEGETAFFA